MFLDNNTSKKADSLECNLIANIDDLRHKSSELKHDVSQLASTDEAVITAFCLGLFSSYMPLPAIILSTITSYWGLVVPSIKQLIPNE